jgi:GDP-4-dehydro-6-deoxy-D-mannose reductase
MIRAYWLATEKCEYGKAYNICSGKVWTMQKVLDFLLSLSTVKNIKIEQDPERMRPSDVQILKGDCSEFKKVTGWEAKIPFEKTLEDTLNYWRKTI